MRDVWSNASNITTNLFSVPKPFITKTVINAKHYFSKIVGVGVVLVNIIIIILLMWFQVTSKAASSKAFVLISETRIWLIHNTWDEFEHLFPGEKNVIREKSGQTNQQHQAIKSHSVGPFVLI